MTNDRFVFNGINAATGDYLLPPLSPSQLAGIALGQKFDAQHRRQLELDNERRRYKTLGRPMAGIDAADLAQAGWGAIFAQDADPGIRRALEPLLEHRRAQAGSRYKLFWGADGYRPPEQSWDFLRRWGHAEGAVDPGRVPYYLLIVGEPEEIPYRFQYLLDAQFAVGRITFDTPDEYARYARSVVQAETSGSSRPPRAAFFGVRNAADQATQMSADRLVAPLAQFFAQNCADWSVRSFVAAEATKARLTDVLGGSETPRIFFSASHGAVFPCGHALQLTHQGALVCQDWPGPLQHRGPIPQNFYFAGEDVADDAEVTGMVAFLFACFSGGTPHLDDFSHAGFTPPGPIAPRAFVAALPKRLLAHPRGAALAVVAHVERAWSCSFSWPGAGPQLQDFKSTLTQLAAGIPVGSALEFFNDRCSQLARRLAVQIEDAKWQKNIDELALADTWTAHNDARGYVIIGDPAVRLT